MFVGISKMRFALAAAILVFVLETAGAGAGSSGKLRFAATADACLANCASENASCKRVCPVTFSTPCLSACDSQAQTCRQRCEPK